jgi:hypothetical protein
MNQLLWLQLCLPNIAPMKCCVDKMLCRQNVVSMKCCVGETLCRWKSFRWKDVEADSMPSCFQAEISVNVDSEKSRKNNEKWRQLLLFFIHFPFPGNRNANNYLNIFSVCAGLGVVFTKLHFFRNSWMDPISLSICLWEVFPTLYNVTA